MTFRYINIQNGWFTAVLSNQELDNYTLLLHEMMLGKRISNYKQNIFDECHGIYFKGCWCSSMNCEYIDAVGRSVVEGTFQFDDVKWIDSIEHNIVLNIADNESFRD